MVVLFPAMFILGVDPGSHHLGVSIVATDPAGGWPRVVRCTAFEAPRTSAFPARLVALQDALARWLDLQGKSGNAPVAAGVELVKIGTAKADRKGHLRLPSLLLTMQARGVVVLELGRRGIPILDLDAWTARRAIGCAPGATKADVAAWLERIYPALRLLSPGPDATDSLALAIATAARASQELAPTVL